MQPTFTGNYLDPTVVDETKTSVMIIDATRPLDRPFSPVSKVPGRSHGPHQGGGLHPPGEVLAHIPVDRTTYWS